MKKGILESVLILAFMSGIYYCWFCISDHAGFAFVGASIWLSIMEKKETIK